MDYVEKLEHVAVLGAAGKMGSGIVLLVGMEMADLRLRPENRGRTFVLHAIDVSHAALSGLVAYLRDQVRKAAEKRIVGLRAVYADRADLVENGEIVEQYIRDVLDVVRPATVIEAAADARVVFEALPEDLDVKLSLLSRLLAGRQEPPWVFSNTSSIPIHEIDARAGLGGRAITMKSLTAMLEKALWDANKALAQKDELLKEWMHSNEAFKRLARKYGKKLGVSDEQRQADWNETVVEVADENPDYENTDLAKKKRQEIGKPGT